MNHCDECFTKDRVLICIARVYSCKSELIYDGLLKFTSETLNSACKSVLMRNTKLEDSV